MKKIVADLSRVAHHEPRARLPVNLATKGGALVDEQCTQVAGRTQGSRCQARGTAPYYEKIVTGLSAATRTFHHFERRPGTRGRQRAGLAPRRQGQ